MLINFSDVAVGLCVSPHLEADGTGALHLLVDAHLGLVLGTAMRRLGDRGLSEEVAQNVFTALAKKAAEIRSSSALPAWLHRATDGFGTF